MSAVDLATKNLPHWDMTPYFPGLDSSEFNEAVRGIVAQCADLEQKTGAVTEGAPIDDATVAAFEGIQASLNELIEKTILVQSYVYGFLSVNSRDELAQARASEMQQVMARLSKAQSRVTSWLGSLDVEALIATSQDATEHAFLLRKSKIEAQHMMSQAEEDLAADLTISGGSAFGKLHDDLASQILARVERSPGKFEDLPISEVRNLAMDPDRDVRRRAFEAEIEAWKCWSTSFAATLNGVKGEHGTLAKRRGWDEVLDQSLFQNHVDSTTLDAMMGAAREAFPDIQRYLKAKAKALGLEQLAWYDLTAPLSANDRTWTWDESVAFVNEQFGSFSPKMRALSERAFNENWIDAEPRAGKIGGAFCMEIRNDESRILANFTPAFDGVSTLGHELGHAYHNLCLVDATPSQRSATPMTLAETASTFCETIMRKAAIANGSEQEQLTILEGALQDACGIVVDITSRFLFEQAVFERRKERELSADEFCALMLDAQQQTYGDALDADALHPYMWAVKGHYYSADFAYYNYPYMFGLLFGLGLYAQFEDDPETFRQNYDALLASTGNADATELAANFGFDIQTPEFWKKSLDVIREDVDRFVELIDRTTA